MRISALCICKHLWYVFHFILSNLHGTTESTIPLLCLCFIFIYDKATQDLIEHTINYVVHASLVFRQWPRLYFVCYEITSGQRLRDERQKG